jgi:hypothetical protein
VKTRIGFILLLLILAPIWIPLFLIFAAAGVAAELSEYFFD